MKSQAKTPAVHERQNAALLAAAVGDIRSLGRHIDLIARSTLVLAIETLAEQASAVPVPPETLVRARLEIANDGRPSLETIGALLDALRGFRPPKVDVAAFNAAERIRSKWKHDRIADLVDNEIV
jgi:hypothetical protein